MLPFFFLRTMFDIFFFNKLHSYWVQFHDFKLKMTKISCFLNFVLIYFSVSCSMLIHFGFIWFGLNPPPFLFLMSPQGNFCLRRGWNNMSWIYYWRLLWNIHSLWGLYEIIHCNYICQKCSEINELLTFYLFYSDIG